MINEYAVEPTLLNNWKDFRYFVEQFGVPKGRLISRYPKAWKRMVYEALNGVGDTEKKRIEESLARIDDRMLRRTNQWNPHQSWLNNADAEHQRRPFHAIVARHNPSNNAAVLRADDVDETNLLWACSTEIVVARAAQVMAQAVHPLLRISREIIFIDPHFGPDVARFRNTLREFLRVAVERRDTVELRRVQVYTGAKADAVFFANECRRRLPALTPKGVELRIVRLQERLGGEVLHNRFILTDIGGVSFRIGLDEGKKGETDEISLLSTDIYKTRYSQYAGPQPAFDSVDFIVVVGK